MSWLRADGNRSTFLGLLSPAPGERILDVGAGKGDVAALVQREGSCEVHIVDPDEKRIASARRSHPGLVASVSGSETIPYGGGSFDKVYSTLAVHHFADQEKSFREIARVLRPGGVLVIVDINPRSFLGRIGRLFENLVMRAHLKFLTIEELVGMLDREGEYEVRERDLSGSGYFVRATKTGKGAP